MLERLLIGILALRVSDESHNWQSTEKNAVGTEEVLMVREVDIEQFQDPARLHVGMLTISLIVCLCYGGYVIWSQRTEKDELFGYIRNFVIALACRIFFTILFDGVIILGASVSSGGGNTLLAFECISQNLVIAFWLMLTVYLHARVQTKFNSEPSLTLYEYGIPGVAVFFAFVWIFAMQAEISEVWSFSSPPLSQWIVASLRLLYLLIQLGVVFDMGRIMMKISIDNDSVSLLRKSVAILMVLVFLFWLQFGLSLERLAKTTTQSYQYFDYFIDGSHGALVSLALFFFYKWVSTFLNRIPSIMTESEETRQIDEVLPTEGQGISTINRLFTKKESGRWQNADGAVESRDVVYSSIVEPHRLQKTLELYKRLNIIPSSQVTVVEGEEFFDCRRRVSASEIGDSEKADFRSVISEDSKSQLIPQRTSSIFKMNKTNGNIQKKNAFYASKYLILDSKKNKIPNNLDTPSYVTSSGRESFKEMSENEFFANLDTLKSNELVKKWLNDHSEDLQMKKPEIQKHRQEPTPMTEEKENSNWAQDANQCNMTTASTSTAPKAVLDMNKYDSEHSDKKSGVKTQILTETKVSDFQPTYQRKPSITADSDASKENHRNTEIILFESGEYGKQSNVLNKKSDEDFSNGSRQSDIQYTSTVDYTEYTVLYYTYSQVYSLVCYTYYVIHTILYYICSQAYSVVTKRLNESFENIEEYQPIQRESISNEKDFTKLVSQSERHFEEDISSFRKTDYQDECERPAVPSASKDKPVSAEDSYKPFNLESLKLNNEVIITQGEVKLLEDEQSLQDLFQNKEPLRQESPSIPIRQMKKAEELQLEHSIVLPQDSATEKEEPSSESEFSIERTLSSSSSVSIDKYYAGLRSNEEIINKYNHPFVSAKKKRPFLK